MCREEKNYMKLMSKKIHAAKSTLRNLPGSKKSSPSHKTGKCNKRDAYFLTVTTPEGALPADSVSRAAAHQGHSLPASVTPEVTSCEKR